MMRNIKSTLINWTAISMLSATLVNTPVVANDANQKAPSVSKEQFTLSISCNGKQLKIGMPKSKVEKACGPPEEQETQNKQHYSVKYQKTETEHEHDDEQLKRDMDLEYRDGKLVDINTSITARHKSNYNDDQGKDD